MASKVQAMVVSIREFNDNVTLSARDMMQKYVGGVSTVLQTAAQLVAIQDLNVRQQAMQDCLQPLREMHPRIFLDESTYPKIALDNVEFHYTRLVDLAMWCIGPYLTVGLNQLAAELIYDTPLESGLNLAEVRVVHTVRHTEFPSAHEMAIHVEAELFI